MSPYEVAIIAVIVVVAAFSGGYTIATLKANLRHERERRELLEKQISEILSNEGKLGYKDRAGIEEAQAYMLAARQAWEAANEYLNAVKKGRYNPNPDEW